MTHIDVVSGTGDSATEIAAFDAALSEADIHNYNLVRLSSVIPPDQAVRTVETLTDSWPTGSIVATVLSDIRSSEAGSTLVAGLGWVETPGGGIFVEGTGESTAECEREIRSGIDSIRTARDFATDRDVRTETVAHTVEECGAAIVAAVYDRLKTGSKL